ncbi:MAG TPA: nuclear transport factor 2 family protein [Labilithrix sp.]|nr:nuclear transport factor 2 family protein [Labilithrix sp.]
MTRAAIKHSEEQLRQAMLASDVDALDRLIHDELLFLGPTGALARKAEDLENYRSARQRMTKLDARDLVIELFGDDVGVVTVLVELEGSFDGAPFSGTYRYIRTWRREAGRWQIIAGAVMAAK